MRQNHLLNRQARSTSPRVIDIPTGCLLGAHEWRTNWVDQAAPTPICGWCGCTERPISREWHLVLDSVRNVAQRFR